MALARGTRLLDRYLLEEQIGGGGMATIMTARDERTGKTVAVKQMTLGSGTDAERQRAWFKREVKAMMMLDHPGIPRLLDHGPLDDEAPFVVIEYLRGFDLERALDAHGPMPEAAVMLMTVKLLGALEAAHALSIVHRDIKPANMFLCFSGRPVLLDFGLARATSAFFGETIARGNATALAGTPQYFAPEQVSGETKLSALSDLFSLGASLYHLLAGRGPFQASGVLETMKAIRANTRRPLASSAHWLHPRTVAFVEHLLAPAPEDRPQSANAALLEAEALLPLFPEAEATLRKYAAAIEHNDQPPSVQIAGTQEVAPVGVVAATVESAINDATQVGTVPGLGKDATGRNDATMIATVPTSRGGRDDGTAISTVPSTAPSVRRERSPLRFAWIAVVALVLVIGAAIVVMRPRGNAVNAGATPSQPSGAGLAVIESPTVTKPPTPDAALPEPAAPETAPVVPPVQAEPAPVTPTEPKRPANGSLVLRLRQWAEVSIDGRAYGRKQIMATIPVSEGTHVLELKNDRYGTKKRSFNVKRHQDTELDIDFSKDAP